ncbi:MAG: glycerol-3-phosphate 1-O-acyltransferase PlsY [Phycisphaerales bacterium]|nr:glycerol-3-phosphate 1-O-acyltransferase PlsY [Phycisphaerales bacterium]
MILPWIIFIVAAYLLGSVPFGVLIARAKNIDIRQHGSKNIGASNVGRVLGKQFGILCFVLDFLKGAIPVLASGYSTGVLGRQPADLAAQQLWLWLAVAAAAVLGHMFSVFLAFAGGKGVATAFGSLMAMWPVLTIPAIAAIVIWFVTLRLTRYISIASMVAASSLPITYLILRLIARDSLAHTSPPLFATTLIALLVIYQHRGNIARLRRGTEPRTGSSA